MTLVEWISVGIVVLLGGFLILALILPPVQTCGPPARRTECKNNLKQLALAMHNYHDEYGSFPPAYIADEGGRPMHSWRVLLLPFLENRELYELYRFDEPWNGPHNRLLGSLMPRAFRCPSDEGPASNTSYLVVAGPKTVFPGATSVGIKDITDGTANTILLVEAAGSGINWLEPRDLSYEEALHGVNTKAAAGMNLGISSHHEGGAQAAFVDGSVRYLRDTLTADQLRPLLERNDGQLVDLTEMIP